MADAAGNCRKSTRRFTPAGIAALLVALVLVTPTVSARSLARDGGTTYLDHVFPVQGPHGARGYIGEFGAPRSGGRRHEGFDIVAACGTPLVAVRGGEVLRAGYDPVLYGNYLLIHGEGEKRSYFYAHLPRPALVDKGDRVGPAGESAQSARPATPARSAATSTSRSTPKAVRSTQRLPCSAGMPTADRRRRFHVP